MRRSAEACVRCGLISEIVGDLNEHQECEECQNFRLDMEGAFDEDDANLHGLINPGKRIRVRGRR